MGVMFPEPERLQQGDGRVFAVTLLFAYGDLRLGEWEGRGRRLCRGFDEDCDVSEENAAER